MRRLSEHVDFVVISTHLDEELKPLVRWRRVPAPGKMWGRLTWAAFFLGAWVRTRGIRADLVHTSGAAPLLYRPVDLAFVSFCHSLYHASLDGRPRRGLLGLWRLARRATLGLERLCYRPSRVRMFAAESAGGKQTLEHHFPGIEATIVPTAIDTTRFRPDEDAREELRHSEGVGPDEQIALFVGRDWELKGLPEAIQGLAQASRLGQNAMRLWVLGTGNLHKYEAVAASAGVAERVHFFGIRRDIERFYQASDLLVLPTLCEMFCRAAHEAAACGLPIVATRANGIAELIGDDEAGLPVERDAVSVGRALARLASDRALGSRLGEEGRRRSLVYTEDRTVEALLDAYERLLAGGASGGRRKPVAIADHPPER